MTILKVVLSFGISNVPDTKVQFDVIGSLNVSSF
jgi:hypothetical protein